MFRWYGAPWRSPDQAAMAAPPADGIPALVRTALEAGALKAPARAAAGAVWRDIAAAQPDQPAEQLYPAYLAALRANRLGPPARLVAEQLAAAFPGAPWPMVAQAELAAQAGDHAAALALGRRITEAFPGAPDGPRLMLGALFALGRRPAAEKLFASLSGSHADQDWYLAAALRLNAFADDPMRQLAAAARLRDLAPANPLGYTAAITTLRGLGQLDAAEALAVQGLAQCPNAAELWRLAAVVAGQRHQEQDAYQRWEALRTRFPKSPAGYVGAVKLSQALQQPATTDQLLDQALPLFPDHPELLIAAARQAVRARRWKEAAARWDKVIALHPDDPDLALTAANALMGPFPGRQKRMPDVLRRIAALRAAFPDHAPVYAANLNALREAKRSAEAEELGAAWAERFPADQALAIARARVAEDRGNPAAALACLEQVRTVCTPGAPLEAAYIRTLWLAGQPQAAEAACQAALPRFPNHIAILTEYVDLATRRGDWPGALERAELAIRRRPDEERIRALLRRARAQILDGSVQDGAPPPAAAAAGADTAEFFKRFESLGATSAGCEFGLVQRRFGAEPFGLLRWAKIRVEGLIDALLTRFDGMGLEENTQLIVQRASADHSEYYVQDARYGYWTHTFVKAEDAPFDRMYKQSVRRVQFLRGKLLEDLESGERIYAFKWTRDVDRALLKRLFAAVKTYRADCTLLCVTLADPAHPKGTLEMLEEGLFLGTTNRFMDAGVEGEMGVDTDHWRVLCERVAAWHDARPRAPAA